MRKKLKRFRANAQLDTLLEPGKPAFEQLRGNWNRRIFPRDQPLIVELGCGSGEFATALAELSPDRNVVGIDRRGARMWVGGSDAADRGLTNVAFLRADVGELEQFFARGEIDELWITFPDPEPKTRRVKHRLTSPGFLDVYRQLVRPAGWVRLKTDAAGLFDYTVALLERRPDAQRLTHTRDLHGSSLLTGQVALQTRYEKRFLAEGLPIRYLQFQFTDDAGAGDT